MKRLFLIIILLSLFAVILNASKLPVVEKNVTGNLSNSVTPVLSNPAKAERIHTNTNNRVVLYDQTGNPATEGGITSQDFTSYNTYDSYGADDFSVPHGETWNVNRVYVEGSYSTGGGPCTLANVIIYADNGFCLPSTELYSYIGVTTIEYLGALTIDLPTDAVLGEGVYWICVQASMAFGEYGQWFWAKEESPTLGCEAQWQNPGGGFGGCTTWCGLSTQWPGNEDLNLTFALYDEDAPTEPILNVTPSGYDFGEFAIGASSLYEPFVISNIGIGTLTINSVSIADRDTENFDFYDPNEGTYPIGLGALEEITVYVSFIPQSEGLKTIDMVITDDRATAYVPIQGTGYTFANDWCPEGNTIFAQSPYDGVDYWQGATSDLAPGYIRADEFWGLESDICDIHFWGITAYYDTQWNACDTEDPMDFEIIFYNDNAGEPGTVQCTYNLTLSRTDTGYDYGVYNLYRWDATLDPCCSLSDGWVSIQGTSVGDPDCWFMWATSPVWDTYSLMFDVDTWYYDEYDLAYCLTESEVTQPDTPQDITIIAVANATLGTDVTISWTAVAGATSYTVYRSDDPYATFPDDWTAATGITLTSWSYTSLSPAKYYRVTANN
ncbi:MAG: hypothetical protein H8E57_03345 [Candidatus Cloacimonetes bacterium]|nr:hypothetical protein [Candidatus Cloacimonadota bacterium]